MTLERSSLEHEAVTLREKVRELEGVIESFQADASRRSEAQAYYPGPEI